MLAKAHQADCGNSQPTTYMAAAADVYEEGALIFAAFRVQQDYEDIDDMLRMCRLRIRVPEQWWGDYLALLGAVRIGERRMLALGARARLGRAARRSSATGSTTARRVMGEAIAGCRPAASSRSAATTRSPARPTASTSRPASTCDGDEGRIEVDLRDNVDCLPNGLNLTEATARTAAMIGVFNSIGADVPPNAGSFRRIEVLLRENCACGIPRHPASCSVATTNLADRVANAVQRGLSELGGRHRPRRGGRRHPGRGRRHLRPRSALRRRAVRQPDLHGHHRRRRHAAGPTAG